MPKKPKRPSDNAAQLEARSLKLPAKPTFKKNPKVKEEEHKVRRRPKGPYRPIIDLGKPTRVEGASNDSSKSKR